MKQPGTSVDSVVDKVRRALCPGSFDPVTNGHLEIINSAATLYDEVVVVVSVNESKSGMFSVDERRSMLVEPLADYRNVQVDTFLGLTVDCCRMHDIAVIVKELRAVSDFDYELQEAQVNRGVAEVDTLQHRPDLPRCVPHGSRRHEAGALRLCPSLPFWWRVHRARDRRRRPPHPPR